MIKTKSILLSCCCACVLLLFTALPASANTDAVVSQPDQDAAIAVVNQFNDSVVAAYEAKELPLESSMFTTKELYDQLTARNEYIISKQAPFELDNKFSDFVITDVKAVSETTLKVLGERTISQTLLKDGYDLAPFYSCTNEGFVLHKIDSEWKISQVIDEIYGANPAMDEYVKNFNDTAPSKITEPTPSKEDIVHNLAGNDYVNMGKVIDTGHTSNIINIIVKYFNSIRSFNTP